MLIKKGQENKGIYLITIDDDTFRVRGCYMKIEMVPLGTTATIKIDCKYFPKIFERLTQQSNGFKLKLKGNIREISFLNGFIFVSENDTVVIKFDYYQITFCNKNSN